MSGFTARHFELLDRWKGHKLDRSDPEQDQAYEELREAYSVTEAWAHAVKDRLFPSGRVGIVKKPTSQAQKFDAYHWARIYPEKHSPDYLAYTVRISADLRVRDQYRHRQPWRAGPCFAKPISSFAATWTAPLRSSHGYRGMKA